MLLVFGSLNADLLFQVEALPRPGETVLCPGYELAAGGKGANQAAAAAKAGRRGAHGRPGRGRQLRPVPARRAGSRRASTARASRPRQRPTGIAVIGGRPGGREPDHRRRAAPTSTATPARSTTPCWRPGTTRALPERDPRPRRASRCSSAPRRGARARSSTWPRRRACRGACWRPSTSWSSTRSRRRWRPAARGEPADLARDSGRAHGLTCVVTLGGQGALAIGPSGGWRVGALAVEPVDTTGAGDAFAGVLAAALDRGLALPEALRRASVAAGLACTRIGAQTSQPDRAAIEAAGSPPRERSPRPRRSPEEADPMRSQPARSPCPGAVARRALAPAGAPPSAASTSPRPTPSCSTRPPRSCSPATTARP